MVEIDLEADRLLSFKEAAALIPGGGVNLSTLHRWRLQGVRGHRLQTVMVGGRRFVPLAMLEKFVADVSGQKVTSPRAQADRERRVARARAELRSRGA